MRMMRAMVASGCAAAALFHLRWSASAQVGVFTKDDVVAYTPEWKGERFPDGRPKVPDEILARMKAVSIEEAWGVLKQHGYNNQFDGNWVLAGPKNPVLVGRA